MLRLWFGPSLALQFGLLGSSPPLCTSFHTPAPLQAWPGAHPHFQPQAPHLPRLIPAPAPPRLSSCPWPVLTLKQLLLPSEEDSGAGPPPEGDGVPGGGPRSPTHTQEIREELLSLEETLKQLEVGAGAGQGRRTGLTGQRALLISRVTPHPGGGGGVLPPATRAVSAWGEHCLTAGLHLRLPAPGR